MTCVACWHALVIFLLEKFNIKNIYQKENMVDVMLTNKILCIFSNILCEILNIRQNEIPSDMEIGTVTHW